MSVAVHDLRDVPPLAELAAEQLAWLADRADHRRFEADEVIFEADRPADAFHVVLAGRVAIQITSPNRGSLVVDTIGPGDVLGISWLLPPYRWTFGARALLPTETIAVDAVALRSRCDSDPVLGHAVHRGFASIIHNRMASARIRLLDLYRGTT